MMKIKNLAVIGLAALGFVLTNASACSLSGSVMYSNACMQFSQDVNTKYSHTVGVRGVDDGTYNPKGYLIYIVGRQGNITVSANVTPLLSDGSPLVTNTVDEKGNLVHGNTTPINVSVGQVSPLVKVNSQAKNLVGTLTTFPYTLSGYTFVFEAQLLALMDPGITTKPSPDYYPAGDVNWIYKQGETLAFLQVFTAQGQPYIAKIPCNLTGSTFTVGSSVYIHYTVDSKNANGTATNPGKYTCYINAY